MTEWTGQIFGRLTVLPGGPTSKGARKFYPCQCSCGTISLVRGSYLRNGHTKSCGCLNRDLSAERCRSHGLSKTPTYFCWAGMISRCYNSNVRNFHMYGGRGIKVCEQWLASFETFLSDMGEKPDDRTIDRIDNNGDYKPGNCRWATRFEQQRNTRRNKFITLCGQTKTLAEWCQLTNLNYSTVYSRLARGLSPQQALGVLNHG